MLEQLLQAVHHNPENILHYYAIIQLYKRNGDRFNEMKWVNALLKQWPVEHWENWLLLAQYATDEKNPLLCWKSLLSSYFFQTPNSTWNTTFSPPFKSPREAFFDFLLQNQHRYFELDLTTPAISIYYMVGTLGGVSARHYLENQLPRIQEKNTLGVIFDWSQLRDVDTFLGGFLAATLENLQSRHIPFYLVAPKNSNFQFLFQFLQLSKKLEKTQVASELDALIQLKTQPPIQAQKELP